MNHQIQNMLKEIGLTFQESKVYLGLLKLKDAKTGGLCRETNIASSHIYKILDLLIKKGLVSYRMQNNIKIFMPSPPETLNELLLDKEKQLAEQRKQVITLIKTLKTEKPQENSSNYRYYEGISGIKGMWYEINNLLSNKSEERICGGNKEAYERLVSFYDEHHKIRNKLKAKAQILISPEDKSLAIKRRNKNTEVKFSDLNSKAEWGIIDNMLYLQYYLSKIPKAFLIKDEIFAGTFKQIFNQLWKQAKR